MGKKKSMALFVLGGIFIALGAILTFLSVFTPANILVAIFGFLGGIAIFIVGVLIFVFAFLFRKTKPITPIQFVLALAIAIIFDALDIFLFPIFETPQPIKYASDGIAIILIAYILRSPVVAIQALEFVPLAGILPIHTGAVIAAKVLN